MAFRDILGQAKPIDILKRQLRDGRTFGAYLFAGEEGIGKLKTAVNFAKAINCLESRDDACDRCSSCIKIDKAQHPDVSCIGSSDSGVIKIEYIRGLKREIHLRPFEARRKVFIIDDAHHLNPDAANALLKVLEEPPDNSLIILISSKPALLFKTILSRCRIIRFYPIGRDELERHLRKSCHVDSDRAHYLAYSCEGRIGAALKLKDTEILRQKNQWIDDFTDLNRPGLSDEASYSDKEELRRLLNVLAAWFRDIYLVKIGVAHSELVNLDRRDDLLRVMLRYNTLDLDAILRVICESIFYLDHNINTKLLVSNIKAQLWKR